MQPHALNAVKQGHYSRLYRCQLQLKLALVLTWTSLEGIGVDLKVNFIVSEL